MTIYSSTFRFGEVNFFSSIDSLCLGVIRPSAKGGPIFATCFSHSNRCQMLVSRLPIAKIVQATQRAAVRAFVSGINTRAFATAATKAVDQIDIDKKNGALAYIPSTSDFELSPISGFLWTRRVTHRQSQRGEQRKARNGEKGVAGEPRGMEGLVLSSVVVAQTVGIGGERGGRCCPEIPGDEVGGGEDWSGSGVASRANAAGRMVRSSHQGHSGRAVEHQVSMDHGIHMQTKQRSGF